MRSIRFTKFVDFVEMLVVYLSVVFYFNDLHSYVTGVSTPQGLL